MAYDPVKTAVIGYGYSAKTFHLPFIKALPNLTLSAISSRQQERFKMIGQMLSGFLMRILYSMIVMQSS